MNSVLKTLQKNPALQHLIKKSGQLGNLSYMEEALLFAAAFYHKKKTLFIVKSNAYNAQRLFERIAQLLPKQTVLLQSEESLRVEAICASPEMRATKIEVMEKLLEDQPRICIMNVAATTRFVTNPKTFKAHCIKIEVNDTYDYKKLKKQLFTSGYQHVSRVSQPLCFAARGGIIDVFSMNYENPIRIEFFDNEIESIRLFDIVTQRTIKAIESIKIIPASEYLFTNDEISFMISKVHAQMQKQQQNKAESLQQCIDEDMDAIANHMMQERHYRYLSYLPKQYSIFDYAADYQIIFANKEEIFDQSKHIQEENTMYLAELYREGKALQTPAFNHDIYDFVAQKIILFTQRFEDYKYPIKTSITTQNIGDVDFDKTLQESIKLAQKEKVIYALAGRNKEKVMQGVQLCNVPFREIKNNDDIEVGIQFMDAVFYEGFSCINEHLHVYTSREFFSNHKLPSRFYNKFKDAQILDNYEDLKNGDYIVHNQHGIGQYMGIVTKKVSGVHKDFLQVVYRGDDVLFVPLEQFQLVRKFVSKEGFAPRLSKLGSTEWDKTKKAVSEKVAQLAQRLLKLYATRDDAIGFAFQKDSDLQAQFEAAFPYQLTLDQERSTKEIKADMEKNLPMDRLLCGDVGFGKTEVAARAAFKAIIDQKQVGFLCPTTILSLQHFETFQKRFQDFGVRIEVINRFITKSKQNAILKALKARTIDILIGTHRLLSKDIIFADLGLLVIDEEQRFGVEHKEKIKEFKSSVDVLSLSATPIPRTLQMSLIGVRSLSQLHTPPKNRMSVQTYVIEKNKEMIIEIIQRELSRKGQVFYLYNNVSEIYRVAQNLQNSLSDAKFAVAHGGMNREEIESVMMKFRNNEYQVLVCTTIIETGIDIPNANTIIIDQADRFGLSQLYQIKGRVGRSDRLAYAYLMYSPNKSLKEAATKRLQSIKEFTQLGSGYKIAMRDLMIRGAGDLLGPQQAGFIDTVGIDMYIEMLHAAILKEKGECVQEKIALKKSQANIDAYIPQNFANDDYEKLALYQKLEAIKDSKQLLKFMEEVKDNYGKLPSAVALLFEKKRLDIIINEPHIESFKENAQDITLTFTKTYSDEIDGVSLFEMMSQISHAIKIKYLQQKISICIPKDANWLAHLLQILEKSVDTNLKRQS